jgi:hypothetical protein
MSETFPRELNLDTASLDLDASGLANFYWPLARAEQQAQRDVTLGHFATIIREGFEGGSQDSWLLGMFIHWLLAESSAMFRMTAVVRRTTKTGRLLRFPAQSRLYSAVGGSHCVDFSRGHFFQILCNGPMRHGVLLGSAVKARRSLVWNGKRIRSLLPARHGDVVACHRTLLLDLHATLESRQVKQTLFEEWFEPIPTNSSSKPLGRITVEQCIDAIRVGYMAGGEDLPDSQVQYFRNFLEGISHHVRYHFSRLSRLKTRLPRELWTGSGGSIYSRMLRNAVRGEGGKVIGHEHGAGEAHLAYFSAKTFIEYESADEFYTYSWEGADALAQTFNPEWHVRRERPEIRALGERGNTSCAGPHFPSKDPGSVRKIMYPSTALLGERVTLDHFIGDYVYVDWSARLIASLRRFGYQVLHKPHPGGDNRYPNGFASRFGAEEMFQPFEQAQWSADALVLDFSRSSTFPVALATNKPVIYIDFGLERWHPAARHLLECRAKVVRGWIDDDNRFQVDWEEVQAAIPQACCLTDSTIVDRYYSHLKHRP